MARFYFKGHPTRSLVEAVLARLLAEEILTSGDIRTMGASPGAVMMTLREKMGIPVKTVEIVEENDARALALAEDFEPDYTERHEGTAPDAIAGKRHLFSMTAAEIARYHTDPEGQAKDYAEIRKLNISKRRAAVTARVLRAKGEPVPESVLRDAFMQIPSATEGTSRIGKVVYVNFQQPEAANDTEYATKKNGDL